MLLENDPTNACVGCGPATPVGLRLAFEKTDGGAASRFVADARWQGFPGRLHSAVLYLALIETMNWSLYGATGKMGLPTRTSALRMTRRVAVGDPVLLRGQVVRRADDEAHVLAEATTERGEPIGSLDRDYAMVDEATFLEKMAYDEVPPGYEGLFG